MQPTARPTMIDMFLRKGDPNISVRTILMKERNPRPINSGEPHLSRVHLPHHQQKWPGQKTGDAHGSGLGAVTSGHSANGPLAGRVMHAFEPPPQSAMPEEPTRDAPMRRITVPVTSGGKIRCRMRTGTKERNISRNEHMREVPEETK